MLPVVFYYDKDLLARRIRRVGDGVKYGRVRALATIGSAIGFISGTRMLVELPVAETTAIVLAGGRGRRVGGDDKGLLIFNGRSLTQQVLGCIQTQVTEILISANRHLETYRRLGFPVLHDELPDFPGPLAGVLQGLKQASHALLLCVPCDTPFLPADLVSRLMAALQAAMSDIAVVTVKGKPQPVIFLGWRDILRPSLEHYLGGGGRQVGAWQRGLKQVLVTFDDETERFCNLNTHGEISGGRGTAV